MKFTRATVALAIACLPPLAQAQYRDNETPAERKDRILFARADVECRIRAGFIAGATQAHALRESRNQFMKEAAAAIERVELENDVLLDRQVFAAWQQQAASAVFGTLRQRMTYRLGSDVRDGIHEACLDNAEVVNKPHIVDWGATQRMAQRRRESEEAALKRHEAAEDVASGVADAQR